MEDLDARIEHLQQLILSQKIRLASGPTWRREKYENDTNYLARKMSWHSMVQGLINLANLQLNSLMALKRNFHH